MTNRISRLLLATSSAILLFGGAVHTLAFQKAVAAVAASNLAPFFGKALKGLWLIDSTMLFTLAVVFGLIGSRPVMASSVIVALLALIPAITAGVVPFFLLRNHDCSGAACSDRRDGIHRRTSARR